jgi:hypothetical protein
MSADLDKEIDLAVRKLLDVEPRADLRARVIERIALPRRAVSWTWAIAPIAAAALFVLAVMLSQPEPPPEPRRPADIVLLAPGHQALVSSTPERKARPRAPIRVAPRNGRTLVTAATATDDTIFSSEATSDFAVVTALTPPAPIVIEQIASPEPPRVASLDVAPLRLPALEVNALSEAPRERPEE